MNIIAVIPAKGHSEGVPGKNKRLMHGKPLFLWSVEQALGTKGINRIVVSSDDPWIIAEAAMAGAVGQFRPPELCQNNTSVEAVVEHAILCPVNGTLPDVVVILQPTSPCRTSQDIKNAISLVTKGGYNSCLSVVESHRFIWGVKKFPYLTKSLSQHLYSDSLNYNWKKRPNRQAATQYMENGSIYVSRYEKGFKNRLSVPIGMYVMDYWSGFEIDTPEDWDLVEFAMKKRGLVG